ncbi:MAG: hypothetical protein ACKVJN_09030, partial [Woeseiales bacterium]
THLIKRDFAGGSINKDDFPEIIELLEETASQNQWAESFFVAARSWNANVVKQIPYLVPIIGDHAGRQFTPADPIVVLGLSNAKLATRTQAVDISIDLDYLNPNRGYKVLVKENPASNIRSIEEVDTGAFNHQFISLLHKISTSSDLEDAQVPR